MILFNARSGSTLFLDLLSQLGKLGNVQGLWFGDPSHSAYTTIDGIKRGYVGYVDHNQGVNGIAYRVSWAWLDQIYDYSGFAAQQWLLDQPTHIVYLDRYDKTRQAVSWYLAEHSKKWGSNDRFVHNPPRFNYESIVTLRSTIIGTDLRTKEWIRWQERPCKVLTYESWTKDFSKTMKSVFEFLGNDLPLGKFKISHDQLQDSLKEEFYLKTLKMDKSRFQLTNE